MVVQSASRAERVREAAMVAFARDGYKASSVRDIAEAAGVSVGLVQHHYPTKAALRDAVNQHVAALAAAAFTETPTGPAPDRAEAIAVRITTFLRANGVAFLYLARALADGDHGALELFDTYIELARAQWTELSSAGYLRPDADLLWAPLQLVVMLLGTVLLEDAVNRHLPAPLFSDEGLRRWERASMDLFQRGVYAG